MAINGHGQRAAHAGILVRTRLGAVDQQVVGLTELLLLGHGEVRIIHEVGDDRSVRIREDIDVATAQRAFGRGRVFDDLERDLVEVWELHTIGVLLPVVRVLGHHERVAWRVALDDERAGTDRCSGLGRIGVDGCEPCRRGDETELPGEVEVEARPRKWLSRVAVLAREDGQGHVIDLLDLELVLGRVGSSRHLGEVDELCGEQQAEP